MSSVDEYRRSAASLLDLAHRTDSPTDKGRLLVMAEAWLDLADRALKLTNARLENSREYQREQRSGAALVRRTAVER